MCGSVSETPYNCSVFCRSVLNDSYCTDVCLLYPPHIIALGCLNVVRCNDLSKHLIKLPWI